MTTDIEICNMALSEIGTQSTIATLAENSNEAIQCNVWYNTLRKRLLRAAQWGFARQQVVLTLLGDLIPDNTSVYPYLFKYAYPTDALKIRYILQPPPDFNNTVAPSVGLPIGPPSWLSPSRANRFIVGSEVISMVNTKLILTNVGTPNSTFADAGGAVGVYTADVEDVDLFDELFIGALASALAYKLCIPLSGNVGMRNEFMKSAQDAIDQARAADGNEAIPSSDIRVDWMDGRGIGSPFGYGAAAGSVWGSWNGGCDNMNWGA